MAPLFRREPLPRPARSLEPPAELAPIPLSQQAEDVATVAALARVRPEDWPSRPSEMTAAPRPVWRRWLAIPDAEGMRVGQLMRSAGCGGTATPDYLLLTVVASRLSGWCWDAHRGAYPKAAAPWFRRAAWALRGLIPSDPTYRGLREALNLRAS